MSLQALLVGRVAAREVFGATPGGPDFRPTPAMLPVPWNASAAASAVNKRAA